MSGENEGESETADALRQELTEARTTIQELEAELAETNEGMIALTLELQEAKERYQKIFEASNDAILLIDVERDEIHEANPQACELFGYSYDQLMSFSPSEIFPDISEGNRFQTFADAVFQGWAQGFSCRTNDGKTLQIEISASVFKLDGRPLLLAAMRDVTRRKRRNQRLQVLNRLFRHNLRNDGNVVQGHADILCQELADSELRGSATTIKNTVERMLGLSKKVRRIQDVLDLNYVSPVPFSDVLEEQRENLQRVYPEATITTDSSVPGVQVGHRLGTALYEAIENAIKHNDRDNPTVQVSTEVAADAERLVIEITDEGPGIPQHERSTIRKREESPLKHGSGVGLWFIQWVISSLGGELTIEDNVPRGSKLSMSVPVFDEDGTTSLDQFKNETIIQRSNDS